ncbi:type II secretion system F family protein [Lacticaseibacillus suihuaensis]
MNRRGQPRLPVGVQLAAGRDLISLLQVGFTLAEGLAYLAASQPKYRTHWRRMVTQLEAGAGVATALDAAGFGQVVVTQAALAGAHGQLTAGLAAALDFLQLQQAGWRHLRQLLVYPVVLLLFLAGIQGVLWVQLLPALGTGNVTGLRVQAVVVGVLGAVAGLLTIGWHRLSPRHRGRLLLRLPGVAAMARDYYRYQFVSGAAQFLAGGLPLTAYLDQLATLAPGVWRHTAQVMQARVAAGTALDAVLDHPLVYPPARKLLGMGQTPALVSSGMALLARDLLAALTARSERWLALVQPVMFLLIGIQIVLMYQTLLGPLYGGGGFG